MPNFPHQLGLTFGSLVALWHLVWVLLNALGWSEAFWRWILRAHFIQTSDRLLPFDLGTGILLLVVAFIVGYVLGYIGGTIWQKVTK